MAKQPRRLVRVTGAARRDLVAVMRWSRREFGEDAALRYDALLTQAFADLAADPERPGSQQRPELATGVRTYHLRFSRNRARSPLGAVRHPRHLVVYRLLDHALEILRILHDARDLPRHVPEE